MLECQNGHIHITNKIGLISVGMFASKTIETKCILQNSEKQS